MARDYRKGEVLGEIYSPSVLTASDGSIAEVKYNAVCHNCDNRKINVLSKRICLGRLERGIILDFNCDICGSHTESTFKYALSEMRGTKYKGVKVKKEK